MTAAASTGSYALLVDGRTVEIREPAVDDLDGLVELHRRMSPANQYLRFFGTGPRLAREMAVRLCTAPELAGRVLVARRDGRIVGVAHHEPPDPRGGAEIAVVVADDMHRRGVGTLLIEHLAARARAAGVRAFVADVLGDNHTVLQIFADAGLRATRTVEAGVVHLTVPLVPGEAYLDAVAERERRADVASLRPLLRPSSVVVVGARGAAGAGVLRSLRAGGFGGALYPVDTPEQVLTLPEPPDLAIVAVPAPDVCAAAQRCGRRGVRALVVVTGGLDGRAGARLLATCRRHGMRLVGPDSAGVADTTARLAATPAGRLPRPGPVAVAAPPGRAGTELLKLLDRLGIGVSSFVSAGDKYDVSGNDLMRWWQSDGATRLGVLHLGSFGNPRKFVRIARARARTMPLLTVLPGLPGLTGQHGRPGAGLREALLRQAGVIAASGPRELIDTVALMAHQPLPAGPRVAVVAAGGARAAPAHRAAAACVAAGLVVTDGAADATLVVGEPAAATVMPVAAGMPVAGVAAGQAEPVRVCDGVPWYSRPEAVATALHRAAAYACWRSRPAAPPAMPAGLDLLGAARIVRDALATAPAGGPLDPSTAATLLASYGIRTASPPAGAPPGAPPAAVAVGAGQDPAAGPLVTVTAAAGTAVRLAPLTCADAAELARLLAPGTAAPAALGELLARLGRLVADHPAVAEVELHPVAAGPDGASAAGARVRVAPSPEWDPYLRRLR